MGAKISLDEHRLWVIFHQTYDSITKCEEYEANKADITSQQLLVLWLMEFINKVTKKPIIMTDLAPSLYRSINSISSIIDRMEKSGLIRKIRDLPDRRSIRLRMTRKGEEKYLNALKPSRELIKRIFSVFTEDELQTLLNLLKKLKAKVNEESCSEEVKIDPILSDPRTILNFLNKEKI